MQWYASGMRLNWPANLNALLMTLGRTIRHCYGPAWADIFLHWHLHGLALREVDLRPVRTLF